MSATPPPLLARHRVVKVLGLGGVGGIAARYVALYLAALGAGTRLVLVDGDEFEAGNASRMLFRRLGNKAAVLAEELSAELGDCLAVSAVEEYVEASNRERLLREGDLVLLAVDNHATRKLVSDRCAELDDVALISGGNDGIGRDGSGRERRGTFGNVQVFLRQGGQERTPPLDHLHPEIAQPADRLPTEASCGELMASMPQILFTNLSTAAAMLNAARAYLEGELDWSEACFDVQDARMRPVL